jgi:hypothetical protein
MTNRYLTEFKVIMPDTEEERIWAGQDILANSYSEAEVIRAKLFPYCTIVGELVAEYDATSQLKKGEECPDFYDEFTSNELVETTTKYGFNPCKN